MGHTFLIFSPENTFNLEGQFRPITALYSAVSFLFFGENPFFYHLVQLIIHIANALLLFKIAKKLLQKNIAFFLSLIFLIHPINVEAVSYIGSFNSPLFLLLGLLALLISTSEKIRLSMFTIICLILLSIFSKETGILFVVIIPLFQYLFKKKYLKLSFLISAVTIGLYLTIKLLMSSQLSPAYPAPIAELPIIQRFYTIPAVIFYYIKTFFLPIDLAIYQRWVITSPSFLKFYLPLIFDLAFFTMLVAIGRHLFKKDKHIFQVYIFFFVWFLIGLLLHSQIIPLNLTVADHWFYFPLIGICGLVGTLIQAFLPSNRRLRTFLIICLIAIFAAFSVRTIIRNRDWSNNLELFEHDSRVEDNYILEDFLGSEYFYRNEYDHALKHYHRSLRMEPHEGIFLSMATVYKYNGNFKKSEIFYTKAIQYHKKFQLDSYQNLSALQVINDTPEQAQETIKKALKQFPKDGLLWGYLALAEYRSGDNTKALLLAEKAKKLFSDKQTDYIYSMILNRQKIDAKKILFPDID